MIDLFTIFNERHDQRHLSFDDFGVAVKNNLPQVELLGTGNATREFLAAQDCAEVIAQVVSTNFDCDLPINLGTGQDISIKNLAELIKKLTNYTGKIVFKNDDMDGQPKRLLDVSRAKQLLNWTAKTNLKDGLIKTIDWYQKTNENIV